MFESDIMAAMTQSTSEDHLDAVLGHAEALSGEWAKDRPDPLEVKYLTASIARGLKLAEIRAAQEQTHQLERLATVAEKFLGLELDLPGAVDGRAYTEAGR